PEEPLGRGPAEPAPSRADVVGERHGDGAHFDRESVDRGPNGSGAPAGVRGRERDELVLALRRLDEAAQSATDVVPHPRPRGREGRDLYGEPQEAFSERCFVAGPRWGCVARTQGALVSGGYGCDRGRRPRATQRGSAAQGFVLRGAILKG